MSEQSPIPIGYSEPEQVSSEDFAQEEPNQEPRMIEPIDNDINPAAKKLFGIPEQIQQILSLNSMEQDTRQKLNSIKLRVEESIEMLLR